MTMIEEGETTPRTFVFDVEAERRLFDSLGEAHWRIVDALPPVDGEEEG